MKIKIGGGKKINIREWRLEGKRLIKRSEGKGNIEYRKEMDAYYTKYKNAEIPLKHDYISDGILDVINYENSFIPFKSLEFEVERIDNMKSLSLPENPTKQQVKEYMERSKSNIKETPEVAVKVCAVPMEVRSWFIANHSRLLSRSQGWFQKYGNILLFLIFAGLTIAILKVTNDSVYANAPIIIKQTAEAFFEGVSIDITNVTNGNTAIGTIVISPP